MATGWQIESQIEDIQAAGAAGFTRGIKIGWRTDSGLRGTVFVPEDRYNPETVAAMVNDAVSKAVSVSGLTGSV